VPATLPERSIDVAAVLDRVLNRFPDGLVDTVVAFEPGRRLTAIKNVTVNEDFFQGHFPGVPLMPGVLIIESLSQVASVLLLHDGEDLRNARAYLRGVNEAKFRKQVVPGDQITLEVTLLISHGPLARGSEQAFGRRQRTGWPGGREESLSANRPQLRWTCTDYGRAVSRARRNRASRCGGVGLWARCRSARS